MDDPPTLTLGFLTGATDPYEHPETRRGRMSRAGTCAACHGGVGIYTVNAFRRRSGPAAEPSLLPSTVAEERRKAIGWKRTRYDWGLLVGAAGR